jgi:pimeloyl-ACP methyl ester carboxylesterase
MRWIALGSRFDWRLASPAWRDWLAAWMRDERPLPDVTKRTLLTGFRPPLGGRASSVPSTLSQDEDIVDVMYQFYERSLYREPPKAVVSDVLRWLASGSMTSREGWVDYTSGFETVEGPALFVAGMTDSIAPPEDVLYALDLLGDRVDGQYRLLSRASGHNEEYGHLGMLLSRHAAWDVDRVILAWLRGWKRLP